MATAPKAAGIMDLPENEDMNQPPQLSPMESYDAVTTALNTASPDAAAQYEQTMNMSLPAELMEMSAEEISQILQLFQYLQENPEEYPAAIADLVEEGVIDAGDLPAEYDEEVLATVSGLLMQALRTKQVGMPQQPQGFAMGGIADAARIVAAQGRGQDTMLAHITPEEAQLLRNRGGMGTINPMTGLREYGWFKKTFGFSSSKIPGVSVVKKIAKPIVSAAKKILASPIGRIVATVALTAFLGPAGATMGGGFFGAAAAAGIAGTSVSLLSGQSLKDSLIAGATAYFGAPGGPVAEFVGKAGITSIAGQAAAASGLIGTAANLATGKSLKESIKSGLTQAAISGGSAIVSNYMAQADGSKSIMDAVNKKAPVLTPEGVMEGARAPGPGDFAETEYGQQPAPVVNRNMSGPPGVKVAPVTTATGMPTDFNISQYDDFGAAFDGQQPASVVDRNMYGPPGGKVAPVTTAAGMPTKYNLSQYDDFGAAFDGRPVAPSQVSGPMTRSMTPNAMGGPTTPMSVPGGPPQSLSGIGSPGAPAAAYDPSGYIDPLKKIGSGIMDIGKGNFEKGFKDLTGGAGDLFMPSGPTDAQIIDSPEYAKLSKAIGGKAALERLSTQMGPGIIRTYGPGIAAGLGATALMGGFKQPEMPESELQKKLSGTPGADLIEADPSKYVIGNLPGVQYDERGNIIGSTPYSPPQTLDDIRVSAGTGPGQNMLNAYAPPAYSPTAGGGQSILQPYNTSSMYANLMNTPIQPRYAAQGGMMSGGIANLAGGGYPRRTGQIEGPGTEKSDSIPAMLSDGEFVMTAGAVRGAGNGSRRAGAKKMYALMHQLEQNAARG
jgi:hypothetical protein